jgi:DNA polymerase-3 subunit alpha
MSVRIDKRDEEEPRVVLMNMSVLDTANAQTGPVTVYIPERRITPGVMESLRNVLASHSGTTQVHLVLVMDNATTAVRADDKLRVTVSTSLFADLKALLGPNCLDAPDQDEFARS